ncbi:CARDB domain-containing protein [Halomicroarcula sp. GCM10025324]|uniref:CARDB domain-containing protein n=1 Tax=Haloarcula TaxID=2237 RepID=UPI0023E8BFF1|nr:CARDB domain-containing protein [Halomicroarcula sp. ZS-22-S1]
MAITHRQLILIGVTVIGIVTVGAVTGGFSEPLSTQNQSPETAGADFVVSELDDSDRITAGEDLTVWTTIQNPESSEQTRQIALRVDMDGDGVVDTTVAEESVTLGGEQSETVELTVSTESMEPGTYDYGISTGDSSDEPTSSGQFVILRPTTFIVDDTDAESPVVQGDSTTITATVSNTGDFQGVQTVGLYVSDGTSVDDGALEASKSFSLAPGATDTVSFTVDTADRSPGVYTYEVRTEDDASASSLTIHQPATFDVTELNGTLDVVRGETANLTGTVENVGDVEGTQTVALMHDGKAVENRTVTLASGESTDLEFSVATANRTRGNYTYAVVSSDYSAAADLRVRNSEFTVTDLRGNETVYIGDPMVFTATVKNTGDAPDTQTLEFKLDIDGDDQPESYGITQNVTLAANETKDVVFDLPYMEDPDPFPVEDFITGTFIYSVHAEDSKMSAVFVAKWPPYSGSGGSADDGTGDVTNGDGTGDETNGDGTGDASEDIEYTTLDEISVAKTNLHYDELSDETANQIDEIFARQPFADGLDITDIYTREEFARIKYDINVPRSADFEFDSLDMDLQQTIEAEYDAQFQTQEGDTIESWDELAQAQYGTDYESLTDEQQEEIRAAYLDQFE